MQPSRELLAQYAAGDEGPRTELEARYRPVLLAFARRVGVDEGAIVGACDAALAGFFEAVRRPPFEPDLATRERLFEQARARIAGISLSASDVLQSEEALRSTWAAEWRSGLVRGAIRALARSHGTDARALQAFELHVIEKRSAGEVAKELGMTNTAVFAAKNLLLEMLEETVERLKDAY